MHVVTILFYLVKDLEIQRLIALHKVYCKFQPSCNQKNCFRNTSNRKNKTKTKTVFTVPSLIKAGVQQDGNVVTVMY